jgi:hypothetical protein
MGRTTQEIIAAIDGFNPAGGNWLGLDKLVQELFESGSAAIGIESMLRIFERFPGEDGEGVFWTIVHGLETLPGYEVKVVNSLRRKPSEFTLLMVNRLLNGGFQEIDRVSLLSLLEDVVKDPKAQPDVRQSAQEYLERHQP